MFTTLLRVGLWIIVPLYLHDNMLVMRSKLSILLLYVCMLTCNTVAHSREYRITQNGVPLDKQLAVIISEINNKPGLENITIKIDGGYYCKNKGQLPSDNHPGF